jgi:hypothetical protein
MSDELAPPYPGGASGGPPSSRSAPRARTPWCTGTIGVQELGIRGEGEIRSKVPTTGRKLNGKQNMEAFHHVYIHIVQAPLRRCQVSTWQPYLGAPELEHVLGNVEVFEDRMAELRRVGAVRALSRRRHEETEALCESIQQVARGVPLAGGSLRTTFRSMLDGQYTDIGR